MKIKNDDSVMSMNGSRTQVHPENYSSGRLLSSAPDGELYSCLTDFSFKVI